MSYHEYYPHISCQSYTFFGIKNLEAVQELEVAEKMLAEAAAAADLTILSTGGGRHQFTEGGGGVTAFVLLSESHISIHSWPEMGMATVEIVAYESKPLELARDHIAKVLDAAYTSTRDFGGLSFVENHDGASALWLKATELQVAEQSEFQSIFLFKSDRFGQVLCLDGKVQFTEDDEFAYHEMFAHPAASLHPDMKDVLILGGGDGGLARELVKHGMNVTMVELDGRVVELCKEHVPWKEVFDNELLTVHIEDGMKYVQENKGRFDAIFVDCTDPEPESIADGFFAQPFLQDAKAALKDGGCIVMQTGSPHYYRTLFGEVQDNMNAVFDNATPYYVPVPTYPSGQWSFTMSWKGAAPAENKPAIDGLRYFTPEVYNASITMARALFLAKS